MDRINPNCGMLLDLLSDFVAGDLGICNAGNLLAFVKQLGATLRDKALQCLDERVGLPSASASFESEAAASIKAGIDLCLSFRRCDAGGT